MNYLVITFRSRSDALAMRSYLSARGLPCSTINAPRGLTQSCGIALKIQGASTLSVSQMMHSISGISWTGRHKIHFDQLKEVGKSVLACRFLVENNEKIKARLPLA